jgi:hypothetical protein
MRHLPIALGGIVAASPQTQMVDLECFCRHSEAMSAGRTIALALVWAIPGAVAGGVAGLLLGLGYITVAQTSSFEGYSGFVVGGWILFGILAGLVAGAVFGARRGRTNPPA